MASNESESGTSSVIRPPSKAHRSDRAVVRENGARLDPRLRLVVADRRVHVHETDPRFGRRTAGSQPSPPHESMRRIDSGSGLRRKGHRRTAIAACRPSATCPYRSGDESVRRPADANMGAVLGRTAAATHDPARRNPKQPVTSYVPPSRSTAPRKPSASGASA